MNEDEVGLDRLARIVLAYLIEPGNHEVGLLVRAHGAVEALGRVASGHASAGLVGAAATRLTAAGIPSTAKGLSTLGDAVEERTRRIGSRIISPSDDEWPHRLADLARISRPGASSMDRDLDPPLCLWARGRPALGQVVSQSVSVVGTRAETPYGRHTATDLAEELAARSWTVVSGGALGIDAAAHRGALAGGGMTVVVLACGIDRPYPASNTNLFEQVSEQGVLVSEWPPQAVPFRHRFLVRNRAIAALSLGTVVVEAAVRSGARNTLARARSLGRSTMAVPGPVGSIMSAGCHAELRGLDTRLVTCAEEIIEEVGQIGELAPYPQGRSLPQDALDPLAARLLDGLSRHRALSAEEVAAAVGVSGQDARRGLPLLVVAGFAMAEQAGYRLVSTPKVDTQPRIPQPSKYLPKHGDEP